jgi:Tfp pilus assembly protein FimV
VVPAQVAPAPVVSESRATTSPGKVHVVQPGESLWAIASDLLGGNASPARIAREVHRLWQLNQDRIGTGNPDLVMAGTRLVLR